MTDHDYDYFTTEGPKVDCPVSERISRYILCELCQEKPATITVWDKNNNPLHYLCDACTEIKLPEQYMELRKGEQ